ncbi:hypothetical protein FD12_GL002338 [Lentilactobacillus rapi DSM 19907 = JCM 15042]|uniref:Uncharacterized protein n=1 Tax=Lentilactobacillus rapi DSM 19907 = JCM 15042 TaxID=1423795 RepID=A0ABR5PDL6_9LACO|nr:hypothetical protein FD12_GL002338 [Lentilactobacillus rapi DSM 19907 = JCM 15042]
MLWLLVIVTLVAALVGLLIKVHFKLNQLSVKGYFPFLILSSSICLTIYIISILQQNTY